MHLNEITQELFQGTEKVNIHVAVKEEARTVASPGGGSMQSKTARDLMQTRKLTSSSLKRGKSHARKRQVSKHDR